MENLHPSAFILLFTSGRMGHRLSGLRPQSHRARAGLTHRSLGSVWEWELSRSLRHPATSRGSLPLICVPHFFQFLVSCSTQISAYVSPLENKRPKERHKHGGDNCCISAGGEVVSHHAPSRFESLQMAHGIWLHNIETSK